MSLLIYVAVLLIPWPDGRRCLPLALLTWSLLQWTPSSFSQWSEERANEWQLELWRSFEAQHQQDDMLSPYKYVPPLEMPVLNLNDPHISKDPLTYLETTYGTDWRERPLLLKGLWNASSLLLDTSRRLSLHGLAQESMMIPYFSDARINGALTPDATAPIRDIVKGMVEEGRPYKIASQLFVQSNPSVLSEVAPMEILGPLFGGEDRFSKHRLLGHIRSSPLALLRGPLTVPIFVAAASDGGGGGRGKSWTSTTTTSTTCQAEPAGEGIVACDDSNNENEDDKTSYWNKPSRPFTGLHCEPIGNIAVQLAGAKEWTLIEPQYSHLLRPAVSPDGRGFFASWATSIEHVPRYLGVRTVAGDAVWVPTWTWHRVDYSDIVLDNDIYERNNSRVALGASLFHFRPLDFVRRNPLYALLLFPYLVGEFLGSKSQ